MSEETKPKGVSFADFIAEADEKALPYESSGGVRILLRDVTALPKPSMRKAYALLEELKKTEDDEDVMAKIDLIDEVLAVVSTDADLFRADLEKLPMSARTKIFELWQEETDAGEASAS